MVEWTEKYRPRRLGDIIGNTKAMEDLNKWADAWESGIPKKRAVVLIGDPGIGKTTCALALANERGWQVVEMNASDHRNAQSIRNIATTGALGETFTDEGEFLDSADGKYKLILLDEADNIFGREDFGGIKAIATTILSTKQPIILIVNDYYSLKRRSTVIEKHVQQVRFSKPRQLSITKVLKAIARAEGVEVDDAVFTSLAERCGGDVRSAIKDLQSLAEGSERVVQEDLGALGSRDVPNTIFKSLAVIFRTSNCQRSRQAMMDLDEDPETLILWIDENIPVAYREMEDINAAYNALSKADIFLGRVKRRQYYGLWGYAGDMMSCGVSLSRSRDYRGFTRYAFPQWLTKMSRSKSARETRSRFGRKLGNYTRTSLRVALQDNLPYFQMLYSYDREFRLSMTRRLRLDEEQVGFLLGERPDSHPVRHVFDALEKVESVRRTSARADTEAGSAEPVADSDETATDPDESATTEPDMDEPEPDTQKNIFDFE